ncbi:MAG: ABC transporter permease, partial [Gemmatimonadaceae bacterium]
ATIVLAAVILAALFAPLVAPFDPAQQLDIVTLKNQGLSLKHLLGTDAYSRDIFSRVLYGARTSLMVAFLATTIATMLGVVWGGLAATANTRVASAMMLLVDVVRSVPRMLLFLVAVALAGALTPPVLAILLGAAAWPATSRMVYALVRDTESRSFVEAARSSGASSVRVFARHIAPHLIGPLTASGALLLADILALESGLSFLGLGVRPPGASWGSMVQDALPYLGSAWWTAAVPCVCLVVTVLSAATIADQLQKKGLRGETAVPGQ